jgi:hypothetical protein
MLPPENPYLGPSTTKSAFETISERSQKDFNTPSSKHGVMSPINDDVRARQTDHHTAHVNSIKEKLKRRIQNRQMARNET